MDKNLYVYDSVNNRQVRLTGDDNGKLAVDIKNSSLVVDVSNFPTTQDISGSVNVTNFPATQTVSGSLDINNFPATQNVSGSLDVNNFPATQTINGSVNIDNFPATQQLGDPLNVANNISIGSISPTPVFNVTEYANGWINYEDTSIGVSDTLTMFFSKDNTAYHKTNIKLTPTVDESGTLRIDTKSMDFRGFKYIIFYNDASVTLNNVKMSIIGSNI